MSPIGFGPSDVNNPHNLHYTHVPESFWMSKVLIFDFDWIVREVANAKRVMPDHMDIQATLEGLIETFFTLRKFEIRLALTSNLPVEKVIKELSRLQLANDFDCIRCSDEVKNLKPSPDLYIVTMETLGIRPYKAIALETSQAGVDGARAAGIFCVSMEGCPKGDYVLKSFMEKPILHMLEEIDRLKRAQIAG